LDRATGTLACPVHESWQSVQLWVSSLTKR
jgi:hypothetical protein